MNKIYCDFCGEEIKPHWDEVKYYKIRLEHDSTSRNAILNYDICIKCTEKLQLMALNKELKS